MRTLTLTHSKAAELLDGLMVASHLQDCPVELALNIIKNIRRLQAELQAFLELRAGHGSQAPAEMAAFRTELQKLRKQKATTEEFNQLEQKHQSTLEQLNKLVAKAAEVELTVQLYELPEDQLPDKCSPIVLLNLSDLIDFDEKSDDGPVEGRKTD